MQRLTTYSFASRDLTIYRDGRNRCFIETRFKPEGLPHFKPRPFVMACRALCGMELKRVHLPCVTYCRMRRVYYGKLPALNEVEEIYTIMIPKDGCLAPYMLFILKNRRLAAVKRALFRWAVGLARNQTCNSRLLKHLLTVCEMLVS